MLGRISTRILRNFINKNRILQNLTISSNKVICQTKIEHKNIFTSLPNERFLSTKPTEHVVDSVLNHATYEKVCSETLDGLNDYFEQLLESVDYLPGSDIQYSVSLPK